MLLKIKNLICLEIEMKYNRNYLKSCNAQIQSLEWIWEDEESWHKNLISTDYQHLHFQFPIFNFLFFLFFQFSQHFWVSHSWRICIYFVHSVPWNKISFRNEMTLKSNKAIKRGHWHKKQFGRLLELILFFFTFSKKKKEWSDQLRPSSNRTKYENCTEF